MKLLLFCLCIFPWIKGQEATDIKSILQFLPIVHLGEKDYLFVSDVTMNWYEALTYCKMAHMELLSLETQTENDMIISYIKDKAWDKKIFHTSGNSIGTLNIFYWASTMKQFGYNDWGPGQPDHINSGDKCVNLYQHMSGGGGWSRMFWNDGSCSARLYVICEK